MESKPNMENFIKKFYEIRARQFGASVKVTTREIKDEMPRVEVTIK